MPMTAQAQLQLARDHGHELTVESQAARDDFASKRGDSERFRLVCTCGWASKWRGSRHALGSRMALHLGDVISDSMIEEYRRVE